MSSLKADQRLIKTVNIVELIDKASRNVVIIFKKFCLNIDEGIDELLYAIAIAAQLNTTNENHIIHKHTSYLQKI